MNLESKRAAFAPLFLLYVLVLAGCASSGATAPRDSETPTSRAPAATRYNLTGYSEAFKQGYGDACAGRRNDVRFKSDTDYQMGWTDGKGLCRR